jgi:hypothetical protein
LKELGWPYDLLGPKLTTTGIGLGDGTAISLLLGWWFYATIAMALSYPAPHDSPEAVFSFFTLYLLGPIAFARLYRYCGNHWWPISLWGRLWTGRWIIPGYDYVFVSPLLAVTTYILGVIYCVRHPAATPASIGITVGVAMWCLLCIGPNLTHWRLTGRHRISFGIFDKQFIKL